MIIISNPSLLLNCNATNFIESYKNENGYYILVLPILKDTNSESRVYLEICLRDSVTNTCFLIIVLIRLRDDFARFAKS